MKPDKDLYFALHGALGKFVRFYNRVEVRGVANIPKTGGAVICPRHENYSDPIIVATSIPERMPHFLAWAGIEDMPLVGNLFKRIGNMHSVDAIFGVAQDKEGARRVLGELEAVLRAGELVVVFPEGNINQWWGPGGVKDFKLGATRLAASAGVPIIPVGLTGSRWVVPNLVNLHTFGGPDFNIVIPVLLPSKVRLQFGAPFQVDPRAASEGAIAVRETARLRSAMLDLVREMSTSSRFDRLRE